MNGDISILMRSIKHFNTAFENICDNASVHEVLLLIIKFQILIRDDIYIMALPVSCTSHQGSSLAVPTQIFVKTPDMVLMMHILIIKIFPVLIFKSFLVNDIDHCGKITQNHFNFFMEEKICQHSGWYLHIYLSVFLKLDRLSYVWNGKKPIF